jgi:ferredoxin
MAMEKRLVAKNELAAIAEKIAEKMAVIAPVADEDNVVFAPLKKGDKVKLGLGNTKNAPKNYLFPRSECMLNYTRTKAGFEFSGETVDVIPTVIFGVKPCDARSFWLLDFLFDQEKYKDPYYIAKRNSTTVVAIACSKVPYTSCFCTSVGGSPTSTEGVDVMITELGDSCLVEFLTEKGAKLEGFFQGKKADKKAEAKKEEIAAKAASEIKSTVPAREIKPWLDANFEHAFWNTLHQKCLACGTCTYLCPTCHCFDIQDETKGGDGKRIRNWDSCMFWLFTKETSGHNPRPSQKERWRQRVMHKFRYYIDMFGPIACVGCGRCVMFCPVNMDIRKIVNDISKQS